MKIESEKGNFFNEKQKEIKGKMIRDLLNVITSSRQEVNQHFKGVEAATLILNVLILFNREILTGFFLSSEIGSTKDELMDVVFSDIKKAVNDQFKESFN